MFDYQHVALTEWPEGVAATPYSRRRRSNFDTRWSETMKLLERELRQLGARSGSVRLKTFHSPDAIRKDGKLRAETRMPDNPGVIVTCEVYEQTQNWREGMPRGRYVELSFECDTFLQWKDNVRAIALALEALRTVERYGVARANARHVGQRKALPPAYEGRGLTVDDAWGVLAHFSRFSVDELKGVGARVKDAYREAMQRTHPDRGGKTDDAAKVNVAYEILKAHLGLNGTASKSM
jgi:hypothetical protein